MLGAGCWNTSPGIFIGDAFCRKDWSTAQGIDPRSKALKLPLFAYPGNLIRNGSIAQQIP